MNPINIPIPINAPKRSVFSCLLIVITVFLLLYFGIHIRFPDDHANKRHPGDPERAEECLNGKGVMYAFQEPTGQIHLICAVTNEEFYDTIFKNRGAPDGSMDGYTVFKGNEYTYQDIHYKFTTVHEYAQHLVNVRGWIVLDPDQFQGPFYFIFP